MRLKQKLESEPQYVSRKEFLNWAREAVRTGTHHEHFEKGERRDYYGKLFEDQANEKGILVIVSVKDGEAFNLFRAPRKYLKSKGLINSSRWDDPGRQPPVAVHQFIAAAGKLMD